MIKRKIRKKDPNIKNIEGKIPRITNLATNAALDDKIPSITNLATNSALNANINEGKDQIPRIINITTAAAPTTVDNKIPNVSDLIKKADYDAEIKDIKNKYFITSDYNKLANNILDTKKISQRDRIKSRAR